MAKRNKNYFLLGIGGLIFGYIWLVGLFRFSWVEAYQVPSPNEVVIVDNDNHQNNPISTVSNLESSSWNSRNLARNYSSLSDEFYEFHGNTTPGQFTWVQFGAFEKDDLATQLMFVVPQEYIDGFEALTGGNGGPLLVIEVIKEPYGDKKRITIPPKEHTITGQPLTTDDSSPWIPTRQDASSFESPPLITFPELSSMIYNQSKSCKYNTYTVTFFPRERSDGDRMNETIQVSHEQKNDTVPPPPTTMMISLLSDYAVPFYIRLSRRNLELKLDEPLQLEALPTAPAYFYIDTTTMMNNGVLDTQGNDPFSLLQVSIESGTDDIYIVRMERESQTFLEMSFDALYYSETTAWQTFHRNAFLRIDEKLLEDRFLGRWLFKVFYVNPDPVCNIATKTLHIRVSSLQHADTYGLAMQAILFGFFLLGLLGVIALVPIQCFSRNSSPDRRDERKSSDQVSRSDQEDRGRRLTLKSSTLSTSTHPTRQCSLIERIHTWSQTFLATLLRPISSFLDYVGLGNPRYAYQLIFLFTIFISYMIPSIQVVFKILDTYQSGKTDACFYNFKCALPLGRFPAFNSIFSNISYVILGLSFIIISSLLAPQASTSFSSSDATGSTQSSPTMTKRNSPATSVKNSEMSRKTRNSGDHHMVMYYCFGLGLIFEGFMSSIFHICPTEDHLQYDSAFMFILASISLLLWTEKRVDDEKRNPITLNSTFTLISGLILINMLGMSALKDYVYYIVLALILLFHIYYFRRYVCNNQLRCTLLRIEKGGTSWFVASVVASLLFWTSLGVAIAIRAEFTNFALFLIIATNIFYLSYYIVRRACRRNDLCKIAPWCCGPKYAICSASSVALMIACFITATISLVFFLDASSNKAFPPELSRTLNRECLLLDFYDTHDIWHFFSAILVFLIGCIPLFFERGLSFEESPLNSENSPLPTKEAII